MKEQNKEFFSQSVFVERVQKIMSSRGIDYDKLHQILNDEVGYSVTKSNLKIYINQRVPNMNFLISLSRALHVSTDYLLDINSAGLTAGIDQRLYSKKYKKYIGSYNLYYYETQGNEISEPKPAKLDIRLKSEYEVTLTIPIGETTAKIYKGTLRISEYSPNVFITMYAEFGEIVSMAFYDESINSDNFRCAVGAMLSISAGDLKRAPVLSRFIITDYIVPEEKLLYVKAHLKLNSKFINIEPDSLKASIEKALPDRNRSALILKRLQAAFNEKKYYSIEESFITNTIKKDENLSREEADALIAELRLNSLSHVNSKINKNLDTTVYRCTVPDED